ncbi:MAG TPA: SUMF1/EgtB/PvdO family nonheme iron enzyme [Polyangiaceae bacterium]|jgi:formylglycine-generating enzyme required for sulfatase activity
MTLSVLRIRVVSALILASALAVVAGACSNDTPPAKAAAAEGCTVNSDCASPLVCAFSRCHTACITTRDCEPGQRCMASDRPFHVCQLASERVCSYNSDCPTGQVCAVDGQCRDMCATVRDCVAEQVCTSGTCADPMELNADGGLTPAPVEAGVDSGGPPCVYNSECPDPLICRASTCALECLGDRDCKPGEQCEGHRCALAGSSFDAGIEVLCHYNSDCPVSQVCVAGACTLECLVTRDCPAGFDCVSNHCLGSALDASVGSDSGVGTDASAGGCAIQSCLAQSKNCGLVEDGCGSTLNCGSCPSGSTCGGAGIANVCGAGTCNPQTCASLGKDCGVLSDGCSFLLSCGSCQAPATCGGTGTANVCGCTVNAAQVCAGKDCGDVLNSCGSTTHCGDCQLPNTCGVNAPNVCGCTKLTCATGQCGQLPDGCGGTLDCGGCATGTCGGAGTANMCGVGTCAAKDCKTQGKDCGIISDGCSQTLDCGACSAPETCGGTGTPNVCGCKKNVCAPGGCGTPDDGCGGQLACPVCTLPQTCGGAGTPNMCGCIPTTCQAAGKDCGVIADGCGGLIPCGSCGSGQFCGANGVQNKCGTSGTPPSCKSGAPGAGFSCGNNNTDCCASPLIPGGTFNRSDDPTYPATVTDFRLDKYEVTVGRFRAFVSAGAATQQNPPAAWSGGEPHNPVSGWDPQWNSGLTANAAAFSANLVACGGNFTASATANESMPMNCVTWYEALAFCGWDGGWLATEAEWNFAASGGSEQRYFPWSVPSTSQTYDSTYANYYGSLTPAYLPVGSDSPNGDGKWGQADLIGNVMEFMLDTFATPYALVSCVDCAYLGPGALKVIRGGGKLSWYNIGIWTSATRTDSYNATGTRRVEYGFRCARSP